MPLKITYHGHSTFLLDDGTHRLLLDPFHDDNPSCTTPAEAIQCTHILVSHGHEDHMADAANIALRCKATVFATHEITTYLGEQGVTDLEPGNTGGCIQAPFGSIDFTPALHSSSFQGRYMGDPLGAVITMGGHRTYFAGDTALFSDMKLIKTLYRPDIAILPIGDRFTMGPKHAAMAAEWISPRLVIPCHYNTWDPIRVDHQLFNPAGIETRFLEPGQTLETESIS
ncbi:MAG: metal-dependent hydrolase [Planctomycetes bacterium TMED75]|nr:metal-dependent hydrolase [Planctomycetaceae bacterium]OUU93323.1 MAG: metal-dependent hydrolase [Planctomycetes bacterium TMED75]